MYRTFTASRISGDGNAVFPDEIILKDDCLIYRKPRLIGGEEVKIRYGAIGSVSVDKHLFFGDVVIETNGGRIIRAKGFERSDAASIVRIIESMY